MAVIVASRQRRACMPFELVVRLPRRLNCKTGASPRSDTAIPLDETTVGAILTKASRDVSGEHAGPRGFRAFR